MTGLALSLSIGGDAKSLLYERFRYPAGETQVRLSEAGLTAVSMASSARIVARIGGGEDVMRLALLRDALSPFPVTLVLPYLPYGRADRRFVAGDCFGLRTFASIIHSMGFTEVLTLDAHSPAAALVGIRDVSALPLILRAISAVARAGDGVNLLFPDAGAAERYSIPDEALMSNAGALKVKRLFCHKKRDASTGKLSGFDVPVEGAFTYASTLIVDDICDGGGTFLGIADALSSYGRVRADISLYVTHGIFSKGFGELSKRFKRIFCSDSFLDISPANATVYASAPLFDAALAGGADTEGTNANTSS